jgi:hypothetical protein
LKSNLSCYLIHIFFLVVVCDEGKGFVRLFREFINPNAGKEEINEGLVSSNIFIQKINVI